jgi:HK97 family phage major capsid protein
MTAQELMQKRAALIAEAKAIAALPELNDEKRAEFDAKMKEAETLKGDIARATAVETEDAALDESAGTRAAKVYAPTAPALNLKTKRGDTESRAFLHYLRTGDKSRELEQRASNDTDMNITTAADGGVLVPTGLYQGIIAKRVELELGPKLGVLDIPGKGTTVDVPVDNGTTNEFVSTAETIAFDRDAPALNKKSLTLVKYTKKLTLSYELLEDEDTKVEAWLSGYVGRALAKTHNSLLIAEALASGTTFALGAASAATATDIPGLIYALPDGYQDNAAFVMRRATEGAYRALTGNNFQFTATPTGPITTLFGYPIYGSSYPAAIGTTNKSSYFGNWSFMLKREAPGLTVLRDMYSGAGTGQINLWYYVRTVYKLSVAEAIRYGTHP